MINGFIIFNLIKNKNRFPCTQFIYQQFSKLNDIFWLVKFYFIKALSDEINIPDIQT